MNDTDVNARLLDQLTLPVHLRDEARLDNYLPDVGSEAMLGALQQQLLPDGETVIYLHGAAGTGKTHLLQACCHLVGDDALYLPLEELAEYSPAEVLAGIASMSLVCLDDLDAVVGDPEWELALFDFYNRAREQGCRLLIAAAAAPRTLDVSLDDLRSRLSWGMVYYLKPYTDEHRAQILIFRARRRGLDLSQEVSTYLISRAPRAMDKLLIILDELDRASLAQQRALSIPFVRQTLQL